MISDLSDMGADLSSVSIGALGAGPLFSAFFLVELAAVIVPGWRSLRVGGPNGRARLRRAALVLAPILCFVQACIFSSNLAQTTYLANPGPGSQIMSVLILTVVTMSFWALAGAIDKYGLGSGFSVIIGAAVLPSAVNLVEGVPSAMGRAEIGGWSVLVTLGLIVGTVGATWYIHSRATGPKPSPATGSLKIQLPASGLAPLSVAASLLMIPSALATFGVVPQALVDQLVPGSAVYFVFNLAIAAGAGLLFGWLFNRPRNVQAMLTGFLRSDATAADQPLAASHLARAVKATAVYIAFVVLASTLGVTFGSWAALDVLLVAVVTTIVMDLAREWRARTDHPDLVSLWPLHRLYAVNTAIAALKNAGIYAFPRSVCHRSMLQFFGPYIPVEVLVPAEDADRAKALLAACLLPTRQELGFGGKTASDI